MGQRERGIVFDIQADHILVATPQWEFVKLPVRDPIPRLGEEIEFARPDSFGFARLWPWLPTCIAAGIVLALGLTWLVAASAYPLNEPAYLIALDINPSYELGVNVQNTVLSVRSVGRASPRVETDLRGMAVEEAVRALLVQSRREGFLHSAESNYLAATVVAVPGVSADQLPGVLWLYKSLHARLREWNLTAKVVVFGASFAERLEAQEQRLSLNRYLALTKLTRRGADPARLQQLETRQLLCTLETLPVHAGYLFDYYLDHQEIFVAPELPAGPPEPEDDSTETDEESRAEER